MPAASVMTVDTPIRPAGLARAASPSSLQIPDKARRSRSDSLVAIVRDVWRSRELVGQFVLRDISIRYTQAFFGFAWALFMPVLIVCSGLMFRLVISTLSGQPVGSDNVASLAVKSLPWAFFSGAISVSAQSIIAYSGLIGKVYFPREALPLSAVIAQLFDFCLGAVALLVALILLGLPFTANALWCIPLVVLFLMFTTGAALLLSCANLFFRDVKYIVQVVLNFGVFATPIFFEPHMLGSRGAAIMMALPLSPFIEGLNISIVKGHSLLSTVVQATPKGDVLSWSPWYFAYAVVSAVVTLVIGAKVFRRYSSKFAEMS